MSGHGQYHDERPTVEYDDDHGVIVLDGVRYSYGTFAGLGLAPVGTFLRIEARVDGTLTVRRFSPDLQADFMRCMNARP